MSEPDSGTAERAAESAAWTEPIAVPSKRAVLSSVFSALGQGRAVAREGGAFAKEVVRIVRGTSEVAPAKSDWRFKDPTWEQNPVYRRVGQTYLSFSAALDNLVDDVEKAGGSPEKARFAISILTSALAPTNNLLGNPAAIKRTVETGGLNLVRGMRHFVGDVRHNGGMPSMADKEALKVGRDLGITPGAVIQRDEFAELLQYSASTETVHERPLLVVPPPIGRYYFLDLRPGRSFVEYAVSQGMQTFLVSWRNPGVEQGDWTLDTYAARVLLAIDAIREVTGSPDVNVVGFCAGGIINSSILNHLASIGDDRIHSATYAVTLLDFSQKAPIQAFSNAKLLSLARLRSRRAGIIAASDMGAAFTWMRPNDLVWNYWVNNYLMGENPPIFDILSWNADGTNLPAALHLQFLDMFESNVLCKPGEISVLGTPVDLATIKVPTFVTGAMTDHLTPWRGCYRTTQLLSGPSTFVLSSSGHIQSLVNPPGNPRASYFVGGEPGPDPDEWLLTATKVTGSWWEVWSEWLRERAGEEQAASDRLGSTTFRPLAAAPGDFVRAAAGA